MALNPAQLQQRLAREELPPIVLLASAEPLLLLEAADAVRACARAQGFGERTVFEIDDKFDWSQVLAEVATLSLFSPRRLIELRLPTGRPGKDGGAVLTQLAEQAHSDVVLLVQAAQWSRAHEETAWVRTVDRSGWLVPMWPIKPHEMPRWIEQRLRAHGLRAEAAAIALLAERVEGNLLAAAQEVDKLALLQPQGTIDAATMQALVADSARFDVFGLVETALRGDAGHALRILAGLRGEGAQVPALMAWIASQLLLLARLAGVQAQRGNLAQAMQKAGLWQSKQQLFQQALGRGRLADFEQLLATAARIDRLAKGQERGDAWRELERLVVGLAAPSRLTA